MLDNTHRRALEGDHRSPGCIQVEKVVIRKGFSLKQFPAHGAHLGGISVELRGLVWVLAVAQSLNGVKLKVVRRFFT